MSMEDSLVPKPPAWKVYVVDQPTCVAGHPLSGANGLQLDEHKVMCRKCRGVGNRSHGAEWANSRGQVFVFMPQHPMSRKDGFYARSKLVMEARVGRLLEPEERVLHLDEDPANDDPDNLKLFSTQQALAQYRSQQLQEKKGPGWQDLVDKAKGDGHG